MCAIIGILNRGNRPASHPLMARMTGALAHRGPDGDGLMLRGPVAFGHRRLSIIDPTGGQQPMTNEDGQVWVTFNGEIYNYRELAAELKGHGHVFRSQSDTEVIVHAWEQWGEDCVKRFRGMFAFGIMDWRAGRLFLARDHFGIKPLYFIQTQEAIAFASELQALRLVPGFKAELDVTALDQYLWLQYIPAPRSIYRQIQKLPPAHCMTVDLAGRISGPREYWRVAFQPEEGRTEAEWVEAVDAAVTDSVKAHLVSDVPFGAFLSGGVDSSLVVANMSRLLGRPVQTFSIGFEEKEFDETPHARFAAGHCGAEAHVEIVKADALGILSKLVRHYGEPFGDSSAVPTYYVSRLARQHVPMVLSGDGADEMFAGYWSHGDWMAARAGQAGPPPTLQDWLGFIHYTDVPRRLSLWRPEFRSHCPAPLEIFAQEWERANGFSLANKVQYLDLKTYLPYDILTKVDIASMMHGLEVRTPLVDLRVVELAATIPERFNLARGQDGQWERKRLLKRVAAKYFPADFLNRPKMGFAMPVAQWFAAGGKARAAVTQRLLGGDSTLRDYFEPAAIRQLLAQNAFGPVWLLTFLEEWLRQNKPMAEGGTEQPWEAPHAVPLRSADLQESPSQDKAPAEIKPKEAVWSAALDECRSAGTKAGPAPAAAPRPRILLIADVPNWIFERHARTLHALLSDEFEFTLGFQGQDFNEANFDLIYPLEFNLVDAARIREPGKYVTGIRSHLSWQPLEFQPLAQALARNFRSVHVVSRRLHSIFQPVLPSVQLLSHGVDTAFFTPTTSAGQSGAKLRLGWAGNRLSGSKKGFTEIIEPLGKLPGVELVFCGYHDRLLSLEQMRDFYNLLDAYVCASDFEGNNNSLLEAAAMQRAILTTDNGAVPEYLRHGQNALIVERALPDFIQAVTQLRDDPARRARLGAAAREAVKLNFDWKEMAGRYRDFFRKALESRARCEPPIQSGRGEVAPRSAAPRPLPSAGKLEGYSFCIITDGKRPQKLAEEIASIRALQMPAYEILAGGEVPEGLAGVQTLALPEAARAGRLGEMRNRLVERARYDHLVVADDDLLFQPDFYQGLRQFGEDYEVLCARFLNVDGTRYWDWATAGGPRGHQLLDYDESDAHVYVTGGLCIMKAAVAGQVQWDEARGFYQGEDLDFSGRLHQAGISIQFNPHSTVVHTDARYTQVGRVIMTAETLRQSVLAKVKEEKWEEARGLHQRLRALDAGAAAAVETEAPAVARALLSLPVRWRGPIFNPSGYASEAINLILPLSRRVELGIFHQNNNYSGQFVAGLKEEERNRLFALRDKYPRLSGGIVIEHNPANGFSFVPDAAYRIGRTMFETDRISPDWVTACNQMDEIWVPSQFNVETFAHSGVERDKLRVMPESVDETEFDPAKHEPLPLPHRAACNFLSIFEWSRRKGWDVLLAAYLREFSAEDDVCLYVRTYLFNKPDGDPRAAIERLIAEHAATLNLGGKPLPRIHILAGQVPQADLPRLYRAADCLVAPSRGEGWGRPHHEAMLMGLPVIATRWSGNTEFMHPENSFLIDYEIVETASLEPELGHYRHHRWAEPSEASLRQALRRVQQHPDEARAKGRRARQDMLRRYSRAAVADLMLARLQEIERQLLIPACPAVTARAMEMPAPSAGPNPVRLRVTWEGSFLDLGSLSHVNRELTGALAADNRLQLTRVSQPNGTVPAELKNLARRVQAEPPRQADVTVRHAWPPHWQRPAAGAWVLIQPWEFGVLPADWVRQLSSVDEIWAPSEYVRRVYVESGVPPSKVKIVPNGIDPAQFRPDLPPWPLATKKKFKFLFVGGTICRKGPDLLLAAYLESFAAADDVCLVIKDFGGQSVYQGQTLEKEIAAARRNPNAPEILYLTEDLPAEAMPRLYAACQCLVHPYRGEGFGLPVLEAMACGLPVVVTGGGATDDFAGDQYACRLPALRRQIGDQIGGLKLQRNGWWLEPVPAALAERLGWIAAHPEEARNLGRAASEYVRREWTWERAAGIAGRRLQDLAARKKAEVAALAARRARKAGPITLPAAARIGDLAPAREFLANQDLAAAGQAAAAAIQARPYHPEAYLLLAEIAQAAGDGPTARRWAQHAKNLAPGWKAPRQFLKVSRNGSAQAGPPAAQPFELDPSRPPRLSVCLIVKNEEAFLGRCLASVREAAWQIIVVDTGSTDRTVAIAREYGAEVHHFAWRDDFSAARNAALEHATGDWVLSLDADEELPAEHRETLRREMEGASILAWRIPIIDKGREQDGCSYVPRLFRNAPGLFFLGRVHEQVFSSLQVRCQQWGLKNQLGRTTLLHHGYTAEVVARRHKIERNLRLLELAIEELPNEPNLLMNHGLELIRSGQLQAGLEQYVEALRCLGALPASEVTPELRETLLTQLTSHLLAAKCFEEIVKIWQTPAAKAAEPTASQHFGLGLAYLELKRPAEAAEQMRHCLAKRGRPALSPVNKEILKAGPNHCLALCLSALQEKEAAARAFAAALAEDPSSRRVRFDFARFQAGGGQPLEALRLLNDLAAEAPGEAPVWLLGGEIALSRPEFLEFARDWTGEAMKHFPEHPGLLLQRAEALLLTQDMAGALPLWQRAPSPNSSRQVAAVVLCEFLTGGCCRHFPAAEEAPVSRELLKWYRQLIAAGAHASINQLHERMEEVRGVAPGFVAVWEAASQQARAKTRETMVPA